MINKIERIKKIHAGMMYRCTNLKCPAFKDYGGRGIKVCDEWLTKNNGCNKFVDWALKNGYEDSLTIDRIDVNGDYCPENCRWITMEEQAANKRNRRVVTFLGKTQSITEWCKEYNLNKSTLYSKVRDGSSFDDAVKDMVNQTKKYKKNTVFYEYKGEVKPMYEWRDLLKFNYQTIRSRMLRGWTFEQAVTEIIHSEHNPKSRRKS